MTTCVIIHLYQKIVPFQWIGTTITPFQWIKITKNIVHSNNLSHKIQKNIVFNKNLWPKIKQTYISTFSQ